MQTRLAINKYLGFMYLIILAVKRPSPMLSKTIAIAKLITTDILDIV
jgi:hypothetical protein